MKKRSGNSCSLTRIKNNDLYEILLCLRKEHYTINTNIKRLNLLAAFLFVLVVSNGISYVIRSVLFL